MQKKKEINITVELDKENVPTNIVWKADDLQGVEEVETRAMLLSLWDTKRKDTLKLDLWTKEMTIDEMKIFFHQTLLSMANTLEQSTNEENMAEDLRDYCYHFADKMNIIE
jgi:gliding motility-associated protein GldC